MDNLLYERQGIFDLAIPNSATIIGVGGTGSWTALLLALSGVERLFLYDHDRLEVTNLNRLPLPMRDIGMPKTESVKRFLEILRPDIYVECFGRADETSLVEVDHDYIFDCTDSYRAQLMISRWARGRGIRYMRVGYDGNHLTVATTVPSWSTDEAQDAGYTSDPSWVIPAVLAAALGVQHALTGLDFDVGCHIDELGRPAERAEGNKGKPPTAKMLRVAQQQISSLMRGSTVEPIEQPS